MYFRNGKFTNDLIFILLSLFCLYCGCIYAEGEISNHITQCCTTGSEWAVDNNNCINYENGIHGIPPVWRGLCLSTFGVCCSKKLIDQQCFAGRLAAVEGSNCDGNGKLNSTAYKNCCKSCQIGLAVSASGHNCSSNQFALFSNDESYIKCCEKIDNLTGGEVNNEDDIETDNIKYNNHITTDKIITHNDDDDDNTFILNDDDDICKKFKVCSQICENTADSYVCKCHKGYKLDENRVTCTKINERIDENDDDGTFDIEEDEDDLTDEDILDENSCRKGYIRNEKTLECDDIDECLNDDDLPNVCNSNQHCYNTVGSYNCLTIHSTMCSDGFRFNTKTDECEDINECLEEIHTCKPHQICINNRGSFICENRSHKKCMPGFEFNTDEGKCKDYNECEDNPCDESHFCVNYPGSYECRLRLSARDRYPSSSAGHNRQSPSTSVALEKCGTGYRYKHNKCLDIDECTTDKNACDTNQFCTNVQGGYRCDCRIGFKMDSAVNACIDINECQINNHNCLDSQRCDNTIGSYTCMRLKSCGTGYTLNAETSKCDDDDECILGTHDCPINYECRNTKGSFRCDRKRPTTTPKPKPTTIATTKATTTTTTTTTTVQPITHPVYLPTTTTTTTTTTERSNPPRFSSYNLSSKNPSYISRQTNSLLNLDHQLDSQIKTPAPTQHQSRYHLDDTCGRGLQRNAMGACVDIDECLSSPPCGSHQKCINTNGSYRCQNLLQCSGGYKSAPDGTTCIDINECDTGEHSCGSEQICRNRIGGYVCSCPAGHVLSSENRCVDINECAQQVCPINSNCINTIGSYYCECKNGFQKQSENDKTCVDIDECQEIQGLCEQKCINYWGSYRCSCNPGFQINLHNNRSCDDINECEVHKSYKLCSGYCNNIPGSYECSCPPGYELGTDKNSCRDIDECTTLPGCSGRNEICTNIRGSYRCTEIQCPHGYTNDDDQKNRCRIISNLCDGDDCYQKPSSYSYNFITLVSKMLIPPQGRILFTLRGPHWYDNIDFDLKMTRTTAPNDVERATLHHFSTTKMHNQVQINLMRSLEGPQDIELELSMTVLMNGHPRGKSIVKLLIIVSQYTF